MHDTVLALLEAHGHKDTFLLGYSVGMVDWSFEIRAKEGSTGFSRPLAISRIGQHISMAHYTKSEYDIDYDPWVTFAVHPEGWKPVAIYRWYSGDLKVDTQDGISIKDATDIVADWSRDLLQNGYNDLEMGYLVLLLNRTASKL